MTRRRGRWRTSLRQNFADGDGRLPRTLEKFLGDRGALRTFVDELFDESKRDSAIGRMKALLGTYFDGDASRLAAPARSHPDELAAAPVPGRGQRRVRQAERPADGDRGSGDRARQRSERSRRQRAATSRMLLEGMLAEIARGAGDIVDRTGDEAGARGCAQRRATSCSP